MAKEPITREEVARTLTTIFQNVFDNPTLTLHDELTALDIPAWDSLSQINLVIASEQTFGITFTTSQVASLTNVGQFIHAIVEKTNARA